jgi:hypothetical protein
MVGVRIGARRRALLVGRARYFAGMGPTIDELTRTRPTIDELTIADPPEAWRDAGFDVEGDSFAVESVVVRLAGPDAGRGIVGCTMREVGVEGVDGLPVARSGSPRRDAVEHVHPNSVRTIDHLVAFTPSLARTVPLLEKAGLDLRRIREEPTPGGAPRQAFFRLAEVVLELVEVPPGSQEEHNPDAPSRFWGLAFGVEDLDRCAAYLGERLGEPRDAVQPGRRIATMRRSAGLSPGIAFMTPA